MVESSRRPGEELFGMGTLERCQNAIEETLEWRGIGVRQVLKLPFEIALGRAVTGAHFMFGGRRGTRLNHSVCGQVRGNARGLLAGKPGAQLCARLFGRLREFQSAAAPGIVNPRQFAGNFDMAGRIENEPELNASTLFNRRDDLKAEAGFADVHESAAVVGLEFDVGESGWFGSRSATALRRGIRLPLGRLGERSLIWSRRGHC